MARGQRDAEVLRQMALKTYKYSLSITVETDELEERPPSWTELREWIETELFVMGGAMHPSSWQCGFKNAARVVAAQLRCTDKPQAHED